MTIDVEKELAALQRMTVTQLKAKYEEVFREAARSGNKVWLVKRIIWRLQANVFGDLPERVRQRALEIADDRELRMKAPRSLRISAAARVLTPPVLPKLPDKRLPMPGTILMRTYKGRELRVQVLAEGFEFDGQTYPSLTAVARAVTGSHWNGMLFFGLTGKQAQR